MASRTVMRGALMVQMGKAGVLKFKDVATAAGVCKTALALSPSTKVSTLMKIAGALGCAPADLLEGLFATDTKEES